MSAAAIEQARREADVARARVLTSVGALQQRLAPSTIIAGAKQRVRNTSAAISSKASDAVRQRPVTAGAIAGAVALALFRKPLARLFRSKNPHREDARRALASLPPSPQE